MDTPSQFYDVVLDIVERKLTVILDQQALPTEEVVSEDGLSSAGILLADDGLPYVCDVTILDPNKVSIIQDWLEEAIERSMESLNAHKSDDFANNYWKGTRGGTEGGNLSAILIEVENKNA